MRNRHHRLGNLPDDFQVRNQKTLIDTQLSSSRQLGFYVRVIGTGGLAVSDLGILAISWIAVKARTIEVGTRRALGAQVSDVFAQILVEASLLSLAGCILGLPIGWEGSRVLSAKAAIPFEFEWANARLSITSAALMNLCFALLPAGRAAHVSPMSALRHE